MDFDYSAEALFEPGKATNFFDKHSNKKFEVDAVDYNSINAWWLAELSRLIYKQESDEIGNNGLTPSRQQILEKVGLEEVKFFNDKWTDTQGSFIKSKDDSFGVLVFRGSSSIGDWVTNLQARFKEPSDYTEIDSENDTNIRLHVGFKNALKNVWDEISGNYLKQANYPVFYTGHSLGGALAILAAHNKNVPEPKAVYTIGSPCIGNKEFANALTNRKI